MKLIWEAISFFLFGKKRRTPLNGLTLDETDAKLVKSVLKHHNEGQAFSTNIVKKYEDEFAKVISMDYAYSFISGRAALSACIYALGLKPGDQVIVPAFTCIAVTNAFSFAGIKPVFCDIELDTYGLDFNSVNVLSKGISGISAILIQHTFGLVNRDYQLLIELARQNGWLIIEDCTHAFGARYKGVSVGKRGHVAFFSSENSKVFSTFRGGVAATDHLDVARRMAEFQNDAESLEDEEITKHLQNILIRYYQKKYYGLRLLTYLYTRKYQRLDSSTEEELNTLKPQKYHAKMPPELAAVGINQLKKIDRINEKRRISALIWEDWAKKHGFKKPMVSAGSVPVFLRYPILVTPEMKLDHSWAENLNVEVGLWFLGHRHPLPEVSEKFPRAAKAIRCCINFPTLLDQ